MTTVPNIFSAGTSIAAASTNANNNALLAAIDDITSGNLNANAGITAQQLADRYAPSQLGPFTVYPFTANTTYVAASLAEFTSPAADVALFKHRWRAKSGRRGFLVAVEFYVGAVTVGGADWPTVAVYFGGTLIGGAARTLNATGYHYVRNTNPFDNPLRAVQDDEDLEVRIGRTGGGGAPTIRAMTGLLFFKEELVPT